MQVRIIDLNCEDKKYKFNLSVVSQDVWLNFMKEVLISRIEFAKTVTITGFKVTIRDNVAKVLLCWKDDLYHEFSCHLDPFGRVSKDYKDIVSEIWQNIMNDYYGEEYQKSIPSKSESVNQEV